MRNGIQTVDRALQLLQAFETPEQELGVTELAGALGVHKSTASRLAATLAARGFLERAPGSESFRLGPELGRLALLAARGGEDLEELARPAMARLAADTGETVNLALLDAFEAVNVAQVDGRHIVGVGSWTGRRTALHCTANGKVLLAFSARTPPSGELQAFTGRTITSRGALERQLRGGGARGRSPRRRRSAPRPSRSLRGRPQRLRARLPDGAGDARPHRRALPRGGRGDRVAAGTGRPCSLSSRRMRSTAWI
jgi:DNA-binding IclR family transcriptional regulator